MFRVFDTDVPRVIIQAFVAVNVQFVQVSGAIFLARLFVRQAGYVAVRIETNFEQLRFDIIVAGFQAVVFTLPRHKLCRRIRLQVHSVPFILIHYGAIYRIRSSVYRGQAFAGCHSADRGFTQFVQLLQHLFVTRHRFGIDSGYRRSRDYVVELIQQHFLPDFVQLFFRIVDAVFFGKRAQKFRVVQRKFDAPVQQLVLCLGSISALVLFQVQFALVAYQLVFVLFQPVEKVYRL